MLKKGACIQASVNKRVIRNITISELLLPLLYYSIGLCELKEEVKEKPKIKITDLHTN